jgi:parallel beta-helix repeat protein
MRLSLFAVRVFSCLIPCLSLAPSAFAAQVFVTNVNDAGFGSLREALTRANNVAICPPPCEVIFNIAGPPPATGYWTIEPMSQLPALSVIGITVDGTTQTVFSGDTNPLGPEVVINGRTAGINAITGLSAEASGVTIRGFGLQEFSMSGTRVVSPLGPQNPITGVSILDNYIGIDAYGQSPAVTTKPMLVGVEMWYCHDCLVKNNLISGNDAGIRLFEAAGSRIASNVIGTDATQSKVLGNGAFGIHLYWSGRITIEHNIIAGHFDAGVIVGDKHSHGNVVRLNSMYENSFGIDLAYDGPTPNDLGDLDAGANDLQNYPVLSLYKGVLTGDLDSTPKTEFLIDIYETDSQKTYEGRRHLMTVPVQTNGAGLVTFQVALPPGAGPYITATATDLSTRNTSEFCLPTN